MPIISFIAISEGLSAHFFRSSQQMFFSHLYKLRGQDILQKIQDLLSIFLFVCHQ